MADYKKPSGAIWEKMSKKGQPFFSIDIEGRKFVAFVNNKKTLDAHPSYYLYPSNPPPPQQQAHDYNTNQAPTHNNYQPKQRPGLPPSGSQPNYQPPQSSGYNQSPQSPQPPRYREPQYPPPPDQNNEPLWDSEDPGF